VNDLLNVLLSRASEDPNRALLGGPEAETYGSFAEESLKRCQEFRAVGMSPKDTVGISGESFRELYLNLFAVWFAGGNAWLVNPRVQSPGEASLVDKICPQWEISADGKLSRKLGDSPRSEEGGELILSTSGTSGVAKAVSLSRQRMTANARVAGQTVGIRSEDALLVTTPPYYASAVLHFFSMILAGGSFIGSPGLFFGEAILDEIERWGITVFGGAPFHLIRFVDSVSRFPPAALRLWITSGEGLSRDVVLRCQERFPNVAVVSFYGMTEAGGRISSLREDNPAKFGSAGRPLEAMTITIRKGETVLGPGETGEIYVESPYRMLGYVGAFDLTEATLTPQGVRTGDIGYLDDESYLWILGRTDDIFKSGAEKVSTQLIRETILKTGLCREAHVVAGEDAILGRAPWAYICPRDGLDLAALKALLRTQLPSPHFPKRFVVLDSLPRTGSGKVQVSKLREV
jgi:acyl-CoA synthetase (AMP-forming)/AMP-acid ligase II